MAEDNVYVVQAGPEDFDATVASPVDIDEYEDAPDELSGQGAVRIWNVPEDGGGELFDEMDAGDLLLFYHDGRYVGVGTVGTTFRDTDGWVRETFWENGSELVYTVESFEAVDLSRSAVHTIFDYSANYYPGTPMEVPGDRVENSIEAIFRAVTRYDE